MSLPDSNSTPLNFMQIKMDAFQKIEKPLYATIKYRDNQLDFVPVKQITDFHPQHVNDFDKNKTDYVIKTNKYDKDNKVASWYIRIGRLGGSEEELRNCDKRISWAKIENEYSEPESSSAENDHMSRSAPKATEKTNPVLRFRQTNLSNKAKKKAAKALTYEKFLKIHLEKSDGLLGSKPSTQEPSTSNNAPSSLPDNSKPEEISSDEEINFENGNDDNDDSHQNCFSGDNNTISALQARIKQLEKELATEKKEKCIAIKNQDDIFQKILNIEKSIESKNALVLQNQNEKWNEIQETLLQWQTNLQQELSSFGVKLSECYNEKFSKSLYVQNWIATNQDNVSWYGISMQSQNSL